jgi:hypothetical protein
MPKPTPQPVTARLTTPAQMVASLPLWLGYVPTSSLVVACCHEPRGRVGLTIRFDLPSTAHEQDLVEEAVRRVVHQQPSRVLVAVYTEEPDDLTRAREPLVDELCAQLRDELPDLVVTEAVLVRAGRFWSYLCDDTRCCPQEGTPVSAAGGDAPVALLGAEQVLRGQVVQPDRETLARTLAPPQLVQAVAARQECEQARRAHRSGRGRGLALWRDRWLATWSETALDARDGAPALELREAADLATSLDDTLLRDALVAEHEPEEVLPLLRQVMTLTPPPFDAPVCTVFAWLTYCDGGGAEVSIALERALRSDPSYTLAVLLSEVVLGQVPPEVVRRISREVGPATRAATRTAPRSRRSRGSGS